MSVDVIFFEGTMFFSKHESNSIEQVFPIPYLSPVVPPTHTTSNQREIQPISLVNHQAELSPSSISTLQSMTQRASSTMQEGSLDSSPFSSIDPTTDPSPSSPSLDVDSGWPIALRKGIWSTQNPYPIYLSYHRLSPSYFSIVSSLSFVTVPKNVYEALAHLGWR